MHSILIANRGEIAIRVAEAAAALGLESVALYAQDDADRLHVHRADRSAPLPAAGPRAYLDADAVIAAALAAGCDAVHPGYGFLAENADFASACAGAGLTFIGPDPTTLRTLGDKTKAIALARELGAPVAASLAAGADAASIRAFMAAEGGAPVMLKAAAGGGGRGMRVVRDAGDVEAALDAASREAEASFGDGAVFAERLIERARHIEVQVIGDGADVIHVWDRDCSLQRRRQKVIEVAPAPAVDPAARSQMFDASLRIARAFGYKGLGTFEFLVGADGPVFIEANPRVQVEHPATEAATGVDLVAAQIRIAGGAALADIGLASPPPLIGAAIEARVNLETMNREGDALPSGGALTIYEPPGGPGVRVDGHGYAGMTVSPLYDSLLAKVIALAPDAGGALARLRRALDAFRIEGAATNLSFLRALTDLPGVAAGAADVTMIDARSEALFDAAAALSRPASPGDVAGARPAGADDGRGGAAEPGVVAAPMQGVVVSIDVAPGDKVGRGATLFVLEAMKMRHAVRAEHAGAVRRRFVETGDAVHSGDPVIALDHAAEGDAPPDVADAVDLDRVRPELAELRRRKFLTSDEARPDAVAKRRKLKKRTARENVAQLCDAGSFIEYGDLAIAAQRSRRSVEDLTKNTPADGMIAGFGAVNGAEFGAEASRTAVIAYDYTVLAGTQGMMNHNKKDRLIGVIERQKTPLVIFCEGGGGRPGDVDAADTSVAGLYYPTFQHFAKLSGLAPMVGVGSGRLFAGNAALLGCCDVVIATRDASIGMGGPAMIEGGGLGVFRPEEVGPSHVQSPNGVIDLLVEDEVEAVAAAKRYLSYFQGRIGDWSAPDPRLARHAVPESRLDVYDVRAAIEAIADDGATMELRGAFAGNIVTALIRVEGRPLGVVANNPSRLSGAIDSAAADKAARFMKLCDAHDLPLLTLVDTPGMMVGPEVEQTALVRHCSRMFVAGANFDGPLMTFILRKAYGLGAQAMMGGSTRAPLFCAGWPTAEIGAMGLEGAVRLGYRKELEAEPDEAARTALFERILAESYARGKAVNAASVLEIDTVIDPADTRGWIAAALDAAPPPAARSGKKRAYIDTW